MVSCMSTSMQRETKRPLPYHTSTRTPTVPLLTRHPPYTPRAIARLTDPTRPSRRPPARSSRHTCDGGQHSVSRHCAGRARGQGCMRRADWVRGASVAARAPERGRRARAAHGARVRVARTGGGMGARGNGDVAHTRSPGRWDAREPWRGARRIATAAMTAAAIADCDRSRRAAHHRAARHRTTAPHAPPPLCHPPSSRAALRHHCAATPPQMPNRKILTGTGTNPAPGCSCQRQMERSPGRRMPKGMAAADS